MISCARIHLASSEFCLLWQSTSYSLFLHLRCFLGGSASQLFSLTLSSLEMFPSLSYILRASARLLTPGKENLDKDEWRIWKRGPIIFLWFYSIETQHPTTPPPPLPPSPSGKSARPGWYKSSFFPALVVFVLI